MNMEIEDKINTIVVAAARMVTRLKLEVAEIKKLKPKRSTNITLLAIAAANATRIISCKLTPSHH